MISSTPVLFNLDTTFGSQNKRLSVLRRRARRPPKGVWFAVELFCEPDAFFFENPAAMDSYEQWRKNRRLLRLLAKGDRRRAEELQRARMEEEYGNVRHSSKYGTLNDDCWRRYGSSLLPVALRRERGKTLRWPRN